MSRSTRRRVRSRWSVRHSGLAGQGLVRIEAHAVRLDVGLVDDVEAVFVAQVVPARDVRIMARPDGVDVQPLHQGDVPAHQLLAHDLEADGIVLVAIDARGS